MKKRTLYITTLAVIILFAVTGCKKEIQQAVNDSITSYLYTQLKGGYWTITRYSEGANDSTALFGSWRTYFNDNNAMISYKSNSSNNYIDSASGSWSSSDISHFTCTYNTGTQYPLTKLTATWVVDPNGTNLSNKVSLARNVNGRADTLQMLKH